jgi:hypothetical protein
MPKVINMLTNVQTAEVSLVRRGANNKRFALTKTKDQTMQISELLKTVLDTEAEGEAKLVETLKAQGSDQDSIDVAVANFRIQSGFKDKLSKEQFEEVAKAAGFEVTKAKKADDDEEDEGNPFGGKKKKKTAKSHVPADMPVEMRKAFDEQAAALETLRKESDEKDARIEKIEKESIRKELVAKCASEFSHVPGMNAEEMGTMLQKAYEVSEDFGKQLEGQWAETSVALKKSSLLQTQGTTHSSHDGSSAMGKMEALAKEYIAKDPNMTHDVAIGKVMGDHPELYNEYLNENPAQLGKR